MQVLADELENTSNIRVNSLNPGDAFDYNSANADVIGWIAARVSGQTLDAYLTDMDATAILPDADDAIDALMDAFLLERAFRELRWEMAIRREWSSVPLMGLRRMLGLSPIAVG